MAKVDVAIITALSKELDAVIRHLMLYGDVQEVVEGGRTYYQLTTNAGITVIAGCSLGMGQLNAALLTRDLVSAWAPSKLILTGIAAGINENVNLGDIVIAEQIVDYEIGKIQSSGTDTRWSVYRSDPSLLHRAINFKDRTWSNTVSTVRPDNDWQKNPIIHIGVILSGNKVIADSKTAGALKEVWSRSQALEMEAAGVAAAVYQLPESPKFIMIKGVCDHADERKNDHWQDYAADAAAAFTAAFVGLAIQARDLSPASTTAQQNTTAPLTKNEVLLFTLKQAFDLSELKTLVFRIEEDWEDISGTTKTERIVNLITFLQRRKKLESFLHRVKEERPGLLESYAAPGILSSGTIGLFDPQVSQSNPS